MMRGLGVMKLECINKGLAALLSCIRLMPINKSLHDYNESLIDCNINQSPVQ